MTAIRARRAAPGDGTSPRNGQPETVFYVYRQQGGNTYAARIARRNAEAAASRLPALRADPGEIVRRRGSRSASFADHDALGGPSWPGFGELGGLAEGQETGTR
jgi:hypothetical protein